MAFNNGTRGRLKLLFIFLLALTSPLAMATLPEFVDHFKPLEFSVAGGVNWLDTNNTQLIVSPSETDANRINHVSNDGTWKVGVGNYFFVDQLQQRQFINQLLLELNVYHVSGTISGQVWQFQLPQFHNYNFNAPISSTRLMIDAKPSLYTWHNTISPYLILGIGASWNKASYNETITAAGIDPASALSLSSQTNLNFACDLGAGFRVAMTKHVTGTIEYIYAFLGNATAAKSPSNGVSLVSAPSFTLYNQSVLFGLIF